MESYQYVLVIGSPSDGLTFYGPYATEEEALEAGSGIDGTDWWVLTLLDPREALN